MAYSDPPRSLPPRRLRIIPLLMALLAVGCLTGCIHYPEPRHTYEFITQYDRMSDSLEPVLSRAYLPGNARFSRYRNFIVGNVAVGENWVESPVQAQRYATYFRMLLARHIQDTDMFEVVALNPGREFFGPTLRLEGKVTIFDTGSGTLRFFSYFLFFLQSGGATDLQVEGRIYDTESGELLMEFVDRRRHLGNTPWLPNPKTFSDEFVMKHTVWETARSLAQAISQFDTHPPQDMMHNEEKESQ